MVEAEGVFPVFDRADGRITREETRLYCSVRQAILAKSIIR